MTKLLIGFMLLASMPSFAKTCQSRIQDFANFSFSAGVILVEVMELQDADQDIPEDLKQAHMKLASQIERPEVIASDCGVSSSYYVKSLRAEAFLQGRYKAQGIEVDKDLMNEMIKTLMQK